MGVYGDLIKICPKAIFYLLKGDCRPVRNSKPSTANRDSAFSISAHHLGEGLQQELRILNEVVDHLSFLKWGEV